MLGAERNFASLNSFDESEFYNGFLWKFCVYASWETDFSGDMGMVCDLPTDCGNCPNDTCLIDCDWGNFVSADG
jgi:hypothetical protein